MNKQAYEHIVGLTLDKRAGFFSGFGQSTAGRAIKEAPGKYINAFNGGLDTIKNYGQSFLNNTNYFAKKPYANAVVQYHHAKDTLGNVGQAIGGNLNTLGGYYKEHVKRGLQNIQQYANARIGSNGADWARFGYNLGNGNWRNIANDMYQQGKQAVKDLQF